MFTAVLDTNVLFSSYLRDAMLALSHEGLFEALWSDKILIELGRSLAKVYPDSKTSHLRMLKQLRLGFAESIVTGYEHLIGTLGCRDSNDEHVLAVAFTVNAECLVTFNVRDFPTTGKSESNPNIIHPDDFLVLLARAHPERFMAAIASFLLRYKSPKLGFSDFVECLESAQCTKIAALLSHSQD
jgi:predicted nucleic acid-binding protein